MSEHQHHNNNLLTWSLLGGFSALTLAPYLLPAIGIGRPIVAENIMHYMGAAAPGTFGNGLAGTIQSGIASIPGIGGALTSAAPIDIPGIGNVAAGAINTIAATAIIGIGGTLLANWMEKHEKEGDFPWSKVIRYTALTTSFLIALPSIIGAISIGITFIASLFGPAEGVGMAMKTSLGATNMHTAAGGLTAILPHFLTCGAAALPLVGALFMNNRNEKPENRISHAEKAGQVHSPEHGHILAS